MAEDPRKAHPIPPPEPNPRNLEDIPVKLPVRGYSVCEWTPEKDGKGKVEQVHLVLHLAGSLDGAEVIMRIKSRLEINRLIQVLERHRDGVWPQ
jgi:hypothetical protein